MAEDSSRTPARGRGRQRRGPAAAGGVDGERCEMCGATVRIDAQGRCPLGHRVRAPADADGVVASYAEPVRSAPPPAAPSSEPAPAAPPVADGPSQWTGAWDARPERTQALRGRDRGAPTDEPLRIPDRLRLPLDQQRLHEVGSPPDAEVDGPGGQHPAGPADEEATDEPAAEPVGEPVARVWPTVQVEPPASVLGEAPAPSTGAVVAVSDLSPDAPSALDAVPSDGPAVAVHDERAYEQEPIEDEADHEPPRGWLERVAAALFVIALVAVAWFLATSL